MNNEYCFCFRSLMLFYRPSFLLDSFGRYTVLRIPIEFLNTFFVWLLEKKVEIFKFF